jgi:hypothetical protein
MFGILVDIGSTSGMATNSAMSLRAIGEPVSTISLGRGYSDFDLPQFYLRLWRYPKSKGRRVMPRYLFRFMKNLCDDTGHQHRCVEGVVRIRQARNEDRAKRAAQHRFARTKRIRRWDMHADFIEIEVEATESGEVSRP